MPSGEESRRENARVASITESQEDDDLLKEMELVEGEEEDDEAIVLSEEENQEKDEEDLAFSEMQQLILTDEKDLLMTQLKDYKKKHGKAIRKRYFFISDRSFTSDFLMRALGRLLRRQNRAYDRLFYFRTGDELENRETIIDRLKIRTVHYEEDNPNPVEDKKSFLRRHGITDENIEYIENAEPELREAIEAADSEMTAAIEILKEKLAAAAEMTEPESAAAAETAEPELTEEEAAKAMLTATERKFARVLGKYAKRDFKLKNSVVFIFIDCCDPASKDKLRALLDEFFRRQESDDSRAKCVVSVMMPAIPAFPGELTALTERELDYFLEEKAEKTPELQYYLDTMAYFRNMQTQKNTNIALIRFANVFGCRNFHTPAFDLEGILKEAAEKKVLRASQEDQQLEASFTYLPDACYQIFRMAFQGKKGNEYNAFGDSYSAGDIKEKLYTLFPEQISYSADFPAGPLYKGYALPDTLKIRRLKIKHTCTANQALKHVAAFYADFEYDNSQNVNFYRGKIEEIQQLEVVVLQEIDRICRKHDIKYFLAGGTLLGAVRNGQPISWDDDLDIGMLRGDFDKFRKVCEEELGERFTYSSPYNGSGSHYVLDKVRLKGTYFSTNFSAYQSGIEDGIFIDVLVYDQTSNRPYFQHLQTRTMDLIYKLILLKWFNAPRGRHKKLCKFLLPILRHTPWNLLHKPFDFVARLYRKKKNCTYLIDSVGKKLMDGPLYLEGLEDTVYVDFAGIQAPIPVNPEPYLIYAYGPGYMEKPPLSKRKCPHGFGRIDLGGYIFGEHENEMREMDLNGELFEGEKEEA